jgi:hypothetical protein
MAKTPKKTAAKKTPAAKTREVVAKHRASRAKRFRGAPPTGTSLRTDDDGSSS